MEHVRRPLRRLFAASMCLGVLAAPALADTDPADLVDALNALFGKHAGLRSAHANGVCVSGSFAPTEAAAKLSKAPHLNGKGPFPVIGRFSMGGGNPAASNVQKDNARGLALHIDLGKDQTTDLVLISAPVFPAKTPEQFLTLLRTVKTGDAEKIGAFFQANPESTRQAAWLKARPIPASYASATYFGVHAFTLTNAAGDKQIVKWQLVPAGGDSTLSDDDAKGKAENFYTPELEARFAKGPAEFALNAVLGEAGDPVDDPTAFWPDTRKSVQVGTLTLTALAPAPKCDAGMFSPAALPDGIDGPEKDMIYQMRTPAYAVSYGRRTTP